ncbi:HAMP domain-containing protein [bacterium]|nr:HAMP domain-containing protein [bacterium]
MKSNEIPETKEQELNPIPITLLLGLIGLATYLLYVSRAGGDEPLGSGVGFFLLINVNIIALLILAFLIFRNVVKLILDRRRKILGSRLRSRLVSIFVLLTLIPAGIYFTFAKGTFESLMRSWFSPKVSKAVDDAFEVARLYYEQQENALSQAGKRISLEFETELVRDGTCGKSPAKRSLVEATLNKKIAQTFTQTEELSAGALLLDENGATILSSGLANSNQGLSEQNLALVKLGTAKTGPEGDLIRGYYPVLCPGESSPALILVLTVKLPQEVLSYLSTIVDGTDEYRELLLFKRPLYSSYFLTLSIFSLLVVFTAIWLGFYLAKSLVGPMRMLLEGTSAVARGNLDIILPEAGDDELSILTKSFNQMTSDLKNTTSELEERRRYMEAVLATVEVGVISVAVTGQVTTINHEAAEILECGGAERVIGEQESKVLPQVFVDKLRELRAEIAESHELVGVSALALPGKDRVKDLQVTLSVLVSEHDHNVVLGHVVLIDDVTELLSAQRLAAWREVARRIAHEVKNPLTPIQLSAERIKRKIAKSEIDTQTFSESADLIISQVETLRKLVNEFSQFARMPRLQRAAVDLNEIALEVVSLYKSAHGNIRFEMECSRLPIMQLDREQIKRALVNLFENACESIKERFAAVSSTGSGGAICLRTRLLEELSIVQVEIEDNGIGVDKAKVEQIFEPYVTTKKGGTGLGLSIVRTVVNDHNGFIRVRANPMEGATFIIELPVTEQGE